MSSGWIIDSLIVDLCLQAMLWRQRTKLDRCSQERERDSHDVSVTLKNTEHFESGIIKRFSNEWAQFA